jgi:AcrR family transcriptional regulator
MAREAARSRILQATVRTLASQGYARTTARAIARTGGFAPGVIYYHFRDLEEVFVDTLRFTSRARLERYRAETGGVDTAVELVRRLRILYAEDVEEGHIAAVQELVAAANASSPLAERVRGETAAWHDYAEGAIRMLVDGTPFAGHVPVAELAETVVATYLGLEMLSHLSAGRLGPGALLDAAEQWAALLDAFRSSIGG